MGVYIKEMKMPEDCWKCPFFYGEYGYCRADGHIHEDPDDPMSCPLTEVPPHGDLIDRNALSKSLDKLCDRVCQYSKAQRKVMCGACPLGDAFIVVEDDAPSIIEEEE